MAPCIASSRDSSISSSMSRPARVRAVRDVRARRPSGRPPPPKNAWKKSEKGFSPPNMSRSSSSLIVW